MNEENTLFSIPVSGRKLMEIERKFLVRALPEDLETFLCLQIEQAYLCTDPVIRIRRENDSYYLTCKGEGMLAREECNLPMKEETYQKLLKKSEGTILSKKRYIIPLGKDLKAELDIFQGVWEGIRIVEVEFPDLAGADAFCPPSWFGEDVTFDGRYHNSWMSSHTPEDF